jgi:hypothetical protein
MYVHYFRSEYSGNTACWAVVYTTGSSRLDPGFYGVRVVHICVFFSSCVALPIVCPSMISCFRCAGPFFGE